MFVRVVSTALLMEARRDLNYSCVDFIKIKHIYTTLLVFSSLVAVLQIEFYLPHAVHVSGT